MTCVLQTWVEKLTFMQQTVLLTAIRGPDGVPKYGPTKMLLRWYRRCILRSSLDGGIVLDQPWSQDGGSFMGPSYGPTDTVPDYAHTIWEYYMDRIVGAHIKGLDGMPHHFQMHVIHAIEIVGYKHPDKRIGAWWNKVYNRLVHDFHLWPEEEEQLDARLGDSREGWLARTDSATVA